MRGIQPQFDQKINKEKVLFKEKDINMNKIVIMKTSLAKVRDEKQQQFRVIDSQGINQSAYTCVLCNLPYDNPQYCMTCDNIFCKECIDEYMFQFEECPGGCKFLNTMKIKKVKRQILSEILCECLLCPDKFSVLDTQKHMQNQHKQKPLTITFSKKVKCSPRAELNEEEMMFESTANRKVISFSEEKYRDFQCHICMNPISSDCVSCKQCEQVWCAHCIDIFQKQSISLSKEQQSCPNRCKPQHFVQPSWQFMQQFKNKYSIDCEICHKNIPLEYHYQHNRRYHGEFPTYALQSQIYVQQSFREREDSNNYQKSLDLAAIAIYLQPTLNGVAYFNKGFAYSKLDQRKQAIIVYRQLVRQKILDKATFFNMGLCYSKLDMNEQAEDCYIQSIKQDPKYHQAYNNLGCLLHHQGRFEEALKAFDTCINLKPDYAAGYDSKGELLLDMKQDDQALACFNKSILIDRFYAPPYEGKAKCYINQQCFSLAFEQLELVIKLDPNRTSALQLIEKVTPHLAEEFESDKMELETQQKINKRYLKK